MVEFAQVADDPATLSWPVIDFHSHIRPPWWTFEIPDGMGADDATWARSWNEKLTQPELLLRESKEAGITLRILSSTIEGVFGISGATDIGEIERHNDYLARLVADHPRELAAFATIDAFSGEAGAREAERAVNELGHAGLVVDSARDDLFAGAAVTRPTLEAASRLGVPVLVHPVASRHAESLVRAAGRSGNSFGRGHVNGTALLSLLESGVLDDLPDLNVVFAGIGIGALVIAVSHHPSYSAQARHAGLPRPNVYFDFMGLDPAVLRFIVDVLSPERVVVGSDWPIFTPVTRIALRAAFDKAGISEGDRGLIAAGNAQRLLNLRLQKQG
jgi:predicted TIM-barrel fold metal-dependent hydrolase